MTSTDLPPVSITLPYIETLEGIVRKESLDELKTYTPPPRIMGVTLNGVESVILPKTIYEAWLAASDAALDHADAHFRAFPIATAPIGRWIQVWRSANKIWMPSCLSDETPLRDEYTHWSEPLPPPSSPPLPAVFVELGAALEKIKGAG